VAFKLLAVHGQIISRKDVFESGFYKVFELCVSAGMVAGHTQTIDSAPVKANASMDTLELKVPEEDLEKSPSPNS